MNNTVYIFSTSGAKTFYRNIAKMISQDATLHEIVDYMVSCGESEHAKRLRKWVEGYKIKYGLE